MNPKANKTDQNIALLLKAVGRGDKASTTQLIAKGVEVNQYLKEGWNPLLLAIKHGHVELVRLLLAHGADPNCRVGRNIDFDGDMPAITFAARGDVQIVKSLIEAGSDIHAESKAGGNALLTACHNRNEPVINLLLDHGTKLPDGSEDEILSSLVVLGSVCVMDRFARLGLDWKAKGGILAFAAEQGQFTVMDYLLGKGVNINVIEKGQGFGGMMDMTPLMAAIYKRREDVVQYLLARGADPAIKVSSGRDAIYWAKKLKQTKLLRILQCALQDRAGSSKGKKRKK